MKRSISKSLLGWALPAVLLAMFGLIGIVSAQEKVVPLRSGIQYIYVDQDINDATDSTDGVSQTVDLHFGDHNYCDFQVYVASGATGGSPTLDFTIQTTADGGSNWASAGTFTQITTTNTFTNAVKVGVNVSPGIQMRVLPTLSADTTFYSISMWAKCRAL